MIILEIYWKVICRYGHVGTKREIHVSRYLQTPSNSNLMDVVKMVAGMPGVKKGDNILHSIVGARPITKEQYLKGKAEEEQNLYLQKLKSYHKTIANKIAS
ncbi:hypothetical protein [Sporosarcina sp. SAFN-010]|uniref:hypothetical protein n=1 Tax=Sporosarcina sp. SAFN-010 TaxID=3387273 RepID=UPI003F7EFDAF